MILASSLQAHRQLNHLENICPLLFFLNHPCLKREAQRRLYDKLDLIMLYGLAGNRLSYLIFVSPHWDYKPDGIKWNKLIDMGSCVFHVFKPIVSDDKTIRAIMLGTARSSPKLNRRAGQCYEAMSNDSQLLELNQGDHDVVLGYELVSHALNARHLAAAIYVSANPTSSYAKQIQDRYGDKLKEGKQALQLIHDANSGK